MTNFSAENLNSNARVHGTKDERKESASGKYQAYPEYKDSGVRWVDRVPSTWSTTPIKSVAKIVNGATPKSGVEEFWDGSVAWITPADMGKQPTPYINSGARNISVKGYESCGTSLVPAGSVVLSARAPIGSLAIALNELCTNQGCKSLIPTKKIHNKFLYYVLSSSTEQLNLLGRGTTFLELSADELGCFSVFLPPVVEQQKIANFLDHETAKIDTLIEKQQQLIQLLKEKRQAVISHAVTKGLNPDVPMKDSGVEWLGEVPEYWVVTRLKYHTNLFEQGWSPQCDSRPAEGDEYGVLKVGCVNHGAFNCAENKALPKELEPQLQYLLKKDDLLISRANTKELVGSAAVVDGDYDNLLLCDKLYRIRFDHLIVPQLVAYYLALPIVRQQIELEASGASHSMQNIGQSTIKELPIAIPPRDEADALLIKTQEKVDVFNSIHKKASDQIVLLQERRTALISAAVTGKIDVRLHASHPAGSLQPSKSPIHGNL